MWQHTPTTIKQSKMLHFNIVSAAGFQESVGHFTFIHSMINTLSYCVKFEFIWVLNHLFFLTLVFFFSLISSNTLTDNRSLNINCE